MRETLVFREPVLLLALVVLEDALAQVVEEVAEEQAFLLFNQVQHGEDA